MSDKNKKYPDYSVLSVPENKNSGDEKKINLNQNISLQTFAQKPYTPDMSALEKPVQIYRCLFCKHETQMPVNYNGKSGNCPYCGASARFLVSPAEFFNYDVGSFDSVEEEDIIFTLELEIANYDFYREAEDFTESDEWESYYRYLRRHEGYHAEEFADILDIDDIDGYTLENVEPPVLPDSDAEIFVKSKQIEQEAIDFYARARERTDNEVLKSLYTGLIQAEAYHVDIFAYLEKLDQYRA